MAVTIVNTPSTDTATQTGTGSTLTISGVTVGSGEGLVVCATMRDGGASVTGVTWNTSESMSEDVEIVNNFQSAIYSLATPTATTASIVITYSASRDRPKIGTAYVVSGHDTTDMSDATGTGNGTSTSISVSITTVTNNAFIIDSVVQLSDTTNPTITKESAQTQTINQEVQGAFGGRMGQSYKEFATAGATTMSWTSTNSLDWTAAALAIKPAATVAFTPRTTWFM